MNCIMFCILLVMASSFATNGKALYSASNKNGNICEEKLESQLNIFQKKFDKIVKTETEPQKYKVIQMENIDGQSCPAKRLNVFFKMIELVLSHNSNRLSKLDFIYVTDMSSKNNHLKFSYSAQVSNVLLKLQKIAKTFNMSNASATEQRQMKLILISSSSSNPRIMKRQQRLFSNLAKTYGHAKACPEDMPCLKTGEIGVEDYFKENTDYDKLKNVWKAWRDVTGAKMKDTFSELVKTQNIGARENGFTDTGHSEWFTDMEDTNFNSKVVHLYNQILPLYKQIHAFVRYRLLQKYPSRFAPDGPIPAHILGNVWAQHFTNFELFAPYRNVSSNDVTGSLKQLHSMKNLTRKDIVGFAENFFHSIGLPNMTKTFWKRSIFEQPIGKIMQCHASASNYHDKEDYRIKMCMQFTDSSLQTIHHEMGHIQYFMAYKNQPAIFRDGANAAFHEAIGDTIQLAAMTPEHFKSLNLIENVPTSEEFDMNYLMRVALEKVAFIPFALTVDTWRWNVFNGSITPDTYNKEWWNLRSKLQGLMPPVPRTKKDADPLAKYHIATNIPYIRYFFSFIMQFQFYESLCKRSGHNGPLHRCDFYNKNIGPQFQKMMSLGRSKPWSEAMKIMTGQAEILTDSILEYFRPLQKWLEKENKRLNNYVGWKTSKMPVE